MHTVRAGSIFPGVNLTCIHTDTFKIGCLSVNLMTALKRGIASSNALLPRVLRRGSTGLPDMERISAALDELYGARIEPVVRKRGELHCIGLYADFPDDRFIPGGGSVLEKTASLAGGILLSPIMRDNLLRADYIESEKKNLIDDIRAAINDKRGYAIDRLLEEMCANEAYGVNRLGGENEARGITKESLTARYYELINNSPVELFYCGSASPERVESALRSALQDLPGRADIKKPETEIVLYPPDGAPKRLTETLDVSQGKLTAGFRLGQAMKGSPDYPALMVFNAVYGSGATSKLFVNMREKLALCYYAGSMIDKHKGIMIVSSGVDPANFEIALDELSAQLLCVKNGDVSDRELLSAKLSVMTAVKSAMDSPAGLLEFYFDSSISAAPYDPDKLCDMVEAVTLDRIVETASGIELDTVYCLKNYESEDTCPPCERGVARSAGGIRETEAGDNE